ncbi:cytosolic phospholipase A2 [Anabrus simplex]|uniref:cytosolic phospholipase A2 n=1 Tax=Anabrus simplex TaxID=316456 RepID=UPI0035A2D358
MFFHQRKKSKEERIVTPKDAVEETQPLHPPASQPVSPSSSVTEPIDLEKKHRIHSALWDKGFDPFQLFEVSHRRCHIVHVHVVSGKNISRGWFSQTPDPYLVLWTPGSPNGRRRTRAITGSVKPVWNERFEFLLDAEDLGTLEVMLMDANRMMDRIVGRASLNLNGLPMETKYSKDLYFDNGSRVLLRLLRKEE